MRHDRRYPSGVPGRRAFLRGLGVGLALPPLESLPRWHRLLAAGSDAMRAGAGPSSGAATPATTPTGAPLRLAFVYVPNGAIQPYWWPKSEGRDFDLARTLQPLQKLKHRIQILGGLDHVNGTPGPDGPGDHARASGTFLTGVRVKKTAGSDIRAGISIDQIIATQIGHLTRFPSLELSGDLVRRSGSCDSGYSCAYQYNLAWRGPATPVAPEPNPRLLFERLFGAGPHGQRQENLKRRQQQQRSILDFVTEDLHQIEHDLSRRDQAKLDEYLVSVREIEKRIERAGATPDPDVETPDSPREYLPRIQVMFDLMALAFQTDSTRVVTFLLASEGSNRAFPEINVAEGHHYLSHHQGKADMIEKVAEIDLLYMRQFARFLGTMDRTQDVDGQSLLHNSIILYGSGIADGDQHSHTNLPVLLAGHGGGALTPGRFVKLAPTPMSNLLLGLADRLGVTGVERLGDSTGRLAAI